MLVRLCCVVGLASVAALRQPRVVVRSRAAGVGSRSAVKRIARVGGGNGSGGDGARRRRPQLDERLGPESRRRRDVAVGAAPSTPSPSVTEYVLTDNRWAHLAMLSMLALLSDWVCFSTAAFPAAFYKATGHEAATLIDIFLFANVCSCFFYTDLARIFGLRRVTVGAAAMMSAGCLLRSGVGLPAAAHLPAYGSIVAGTVLVGLAQPIFQCAPPLLSATWFAAQERALATATALNANQLGIALAFVVGGTVAAHPVTEGSIDSYFELITAFSVLATVVVACCFRDRPPSPPTASAAAALIAMQIEESERTTRFELTYPRKARQLVRVNGFNAALAAFVASIGVTNVVSAFAGDALDRAGVSPTTLGCVGAAFQIAIVLGGIALGAYVDETRTFKKTTLACLGTTLALLVLLGVACGYDADIPQPVVIGALLALGAAIGPVQPINAELAVEVTHPADENAVEATQQLSGNLFSALLVPVYQAAANYDVQLESQTEGRPPLHFGFGQDVAADLGRFNVPGILLPEPMHMVAHDMRGDTLLLLVLVASTLAYFSKFDFDLKRSAFDDA